MTSSLRVGSNLRLAYRFLVSTAFFDVEDVATEDESASSGVGEEEVNAADVDVHAELVA